MNFINGKDAISIEFRNNLIRLVIGKVYKDNLFIKNSLFIDLPDNIYVDGQIIDYEQLLYILKRQLEVHNVKAKDAHVLLGTDRIIIREINVPEICESEYETFLEYNIGDYIPINIKDYIIKSIVVDSIIRNDSKKLLVIAAPRDLVMEFYRLLLNLKLNPLSLDIVPNSISKLLFYKGEFEYIAVIGIDYRQINIVICNHGQLRYTKTLDIGYIKLLEYLKDYDLDRYSLLNILSDKKLDYESSEYNEILLSNSSFQNLILKEIELVLKYYVEDESIKKIYLYEEYSNINNIEDIFTQYFSCKCEKLSVLDDSEFKGDFSYYGNCIGGLIRL